MSNTVVTLESLVSTKRAVLSYVSYMDTQMGNANKIVVGMSSSVWVGKDYDQYLRKWHQLSSSSSVFVKYKNELNYFGNFLGYVKDRYETAQSHARTMFSRL